jgi:hypothetical protein
MAKTPKYFLHYLESNRWSAAYANIQGRVPHRGRALASARTPSARQTGPSLNSALDPYKESANTRLT